MPTRVIITLLLQSEHAGMASVSRVHLVVLSSLREAISLFKRTGLFVGNVRKLIN